MNRITTVLILLLSLSAPELAASNDSTAEINALLKTIEQTECQFYRNNRRYPGIEAAEHVRNKYHDFKAEIDTTEEFIELCASKSSLTGKPYTITCDGQKSINSQEWLQEKLQRYRAGKISSN